MKKHGFVLPNFQNSIVNLAATISQFLGNKPKFPVLPELAQKLNQQDKNLVYLVIDAMGTKILEKHLPATSFLRRHQIKTITSVFPSTTASATTSLITGQSASMHGWFDWALNFDGVVVEVFRNRNYYTKEYLADPDFIRKKLPYQCFWETATVHRKNYTVFPGFCYRNSVSDNLSYKNTNEMFRVLHKTCREPGQKFIYAYFSEVDSVMHHAGTNSGKVRRILKKLDRKITRLVKRNPDTKFVITADHGHIDIKDYIFINEDQAVIDCLAQPMSWESRAICFKIKPGSDDQFKKAFSKYADDYTLFATDELISQGIFGETKIKPAFRKLMGDYIAVGADTCKMMVLKNVTPKEKKKLHRSIHGGMTPDEMHVPVIVAGGE